MHIYLEKLTQTFFMVLYYMEITLVFIIAIIVFALYLTAFKQEENFQNIADYNNLDLSLNKILRNGNPVINSVVPNEKEYNQEKVTLLEKQSSPLKELNQTMPTAMYMVENSPVYTKDNKQYYNDWRFPMAPIELAFAANPDKYVKEHPKRYPSYVYENKKKLFM